MSGVCCLASRVSLLRCTDGDTRPLRVGGREREWSRGDGDGDGDVRCWSYLSPIGGGVQKRCSRDGDADGRIHRRVSTGPAQVGSCGVCDVVAEGEAADVMVVVIAS